MAEERIHPDKNGAGYEVQDADIREVILTGVGLAVGTLIVCLVMWGLFNLLKTQQSKKGAPTVNLMAPQAHFPPEPRLQVNAPAELEQFHEQEDKILDTYGWVDKNAGTVHLPIDKAMDIMAQKGFPTRPAGQGSQAVQGRGNGK